MTLLAFLRRAAGNGATFGLVLGFVLGLVVASVAIPKRQGTEVVTGQGRATGVIGGEDGAVGGTATTVGGDGAGGVATGSTVAGGRAGTGATRSADGGGPAGGGAVEEGQSGSSETGGGTAAATGPVRGVAADKVVIGVAYPDLSALRALGPAYDNGEPDKHWRAVVDGWRRQGLLPVHGRDVELKFRTYNVLNTEEQRAACRGLVTDDKVFAVVGQTYFYVGAECVAREFQTPLITSDGPNDDIFQRSHPYLFSLSASESRHLRNFVHWAHHKGHLAGKKIGIYYLDVANDRELVNRNVKAELAKLGYEVAVEHTTGQQLGGPQDAVAVQRFRAAGVNVALLYTSKGGFMQQAQAQGYKPLYLESDFAFGTSDTATSNYPAQQFDGAIGMTGRRVGETSAGIPLGAEGDACVANYERFTGEKLTKETAEWAYVLTTCDLGKTVLQALNAAGPGLTVDGFVAGLQTVSGMPMTRYADVTWTASRHDGGDAQRTVRWRIDCRCWRAEGQFEPLWVP